MEVDLALKKVPAEVKDLIAREAQAHRRSINQEAIVLIEEALAQRAGRSSRSSRDEIKLILDRYAALPKRGPAKAAEIIEFGDTGAPK